MENGVSQDAMIRALLAKVNEISGENIKLMATIYDLQDKIKKLEGDDNDDESKTEKNGH
ncbi:hypothetical protein lacNasYZ03_11790 [Lactobacillus nasalidis]|uniref:Phage protein n=1 Tax=Lactobacillus nasalidis TaxID=2797258 RepID=A0ABQ3WBA3_9LACO|nr:hypothetical protein [Lactobacillus nasalidis]GHV97903.1 hypothetical protein lacNasYZ01_10850 [Lactobacillus nasalidis]GHW00133.1 hypothetical protein lacNasYZ02_15620 [Lactobacillus nasalidis]GHW01492.1 hypothetical protein lacNasYZ03_11790 [Lactobacillus nasalidis]